MEDPQVEVLLATFNGERFLQQQIESILAQTGAGVTVLARDDGSEDRSVAILADYAARLPGRFRVLPTGDPTGTAKGNFLCLLRQSKAQYIAFADQDDVWLPDKLARSLAAMQALEQQHGQTVPLLVFTDLRVVDDELREVRASFWENQGIDPRTIDTLSRVLVQNVVTGCTTLLNRPLADLARRMPAGASMHDWWVALLATCFGHAASVREPTVLYRQHTGNVLGATQESNSGLPQLRRHAARRASWAAAVAQARGLEAVHGTELTANQRRTVLALIACDEHPARIARIVTLLRHSLLIRGLRPNLATLLYLWDKRAADQASSAAD